MSYWLPQVTFNPDGFEKHLTYGDHVSCNANTMLALSFLFKSKFTSLVVAFMGLVKAVTQFHWRKLPTFLIHELFGTIPYHHRIATNATHKSFNNC